MRKCLALLLLFGLVPAWATPKIDGTPLQGEVLEAINAGAYTYLRLQTKDGEIWAATMLSNYAKGARLQLNDPALMTNFTSKALGKTFDQIVFASSISTETGDLANPAAQMAETHKGATASAANVAVVKAPKAAGPNGRTVAEVYAQRAQLKDKTVAVQGTVVKFSGNILDRNWVHLRDGSGSAANGSNDLLVTTKQAVKVGDVVIASGTIKTDVNYGSGYAYPVVIENATLN